MALLYALGCGLVLGFNTPSLAQPANIHPPHLEQAPDPLWPTGHHEIHHLDVHVRLIVTKEGKVQSVEVMDTTVHPDFAQAAQQVVLQWRFAPAMRDGHPIPSKILGIVHFKAPPPPTPTAPVSRPPAKTDTPKPATTPADDPDSIPQLPTTSQVIVEGKKPAGTQAAAAGDFKIRIGQLRDVPRRNAEQLLTLAPGFLLTNHGGEGHASGIFLRGFNAAEGQDIEFSVNGIPINEVSNPHGHGYSDTHFVISELVDRLQIIEGPFDPSQGDFAVAGSARYHLGWEQRGWMMKAGYGSFNTRRALVVWGPKGAGKDTFVGGEWVQGDGFGPNRAHAALRIMGQHSVWLNDSTRIRFLGTSYTTRYDSAGVIRQDDFEAKRLPCGSSSDDQFFCLYDNNQGGGIARHTLSIALEKETLHSRQEHITYLTFRQLRIRENFTGFLTDTALDQSQRGDGVEQVYNVTTVGFRGNYHWHAPWHKREQHFELGYFTRYDTGISQQRRLRFADGVPYRVDFDNELRISDLGAYLSTKVHPLSFLLVSGGLRVDGFGFAVKNNNRPVLDRSGTRLSSDYVEAFGLAIQPRASIELLLTKQLSWQNSAGVGVRSSGAFGLSDGEFAPFARVTAAESGLAFKTKDRNFGKLEARLISYYTRVQRDLVFDENQARNVFAGASNRFGAMATTRLVHPYGLDTQASLTYAEAYLPPTSAKFYDLTAGTRLPYIPRWVFRSDTSLRRPITIAHTKLITTGAMGVTYVAPRPLPFSQLSPPLAMIDIAAKVRWQAWELGLEVTNLMDRRNRPVVFNYVSNFRGSDVPASQLPQLSFAGGAPRMMMATLAFYLDTPAEQEKPGT
jgi:iron complex outermembrane recepter protein